MIFGAILAGGIGTRLNISDIPKQFLPLGNKPIIIHTVERFLACGRMDAVFIGVHCDWLDHMGTLIKQYVPEKANQIHVIEGGVDRTDTILRLLNAIENKYGEDNSHIVLTHDGVRPFVTMRMIEENIDAAILYGAVNTVSPAIDTIVVSNDGNTITDVPERSKMFLGQSPQTFRLKELKKLYASLSTEEKGILTDASKIYVMKGLPVHLVRGEFSNIKITTLADYKIAQAIAVDFFAMD